MTRNEETGGWGITPEYAPAGMRCLSQDVSGLEIAMNENPLTPDQMRALGEQLIREADTIDARHEGED